MDPVDYARIISALIVIVAMIAGLALLVWKSGLAKGGLSLASQKRLKIEDSLAIDARRRAVILSCDGREHLIVLGSTADTVIENNIPPTEGIEEKEQKKFRSKSFAELMRATIDNSRENPFLVKGAARRSESGDSEQGAAA